MEKKKKKEKRLCCCSWLKFEGVKEFVGKEINILVNKFFLYLVFKIHVSRFSRVNRWLCIGGTNTKFIL